MVWFLRFFWALLVSVFGSRGYISRMADEISAKYHDRPVCLTLLMLAGIMWSGAVLGHYTLLIFWEPPGLREMSVLNISRFLVGWATIIFGPFLLPWGIHLLRHSSWRLAQL